jgi:SprT protein
LIHPKLLREAKMNENEMRDAIVARSRELILLACSKYNLSRENIQFNIAFDLKGRVSGQATRIGKGREYLLDFNLPLAMLNQDEFLQHTVIHEVAHVIDWMRNGSSSHGYNWKVIMDGCFNTAPDRCSHYDNSLPDNNRKHEYKCSSCDEVWNVTSRFHNRVASRQTMLAPCRCGGKVEYAGKKLSSFFSEES